jgi:hypothetical protein
MKTLEVDKPFLPTLFTWIFKWLAGFLISFVIAVCGLSLIDYGTFSFVFVFVCAQILFWRVFHDLSLISVLLFDAVIVFLFLILRLYVVLGPDF